MESIASSYGLALFEIAKEDNDLGGYKKDLDFVLTALEPEHLRFFNQAMVSQEERIALLEKCFKESIQPNVLNFLKVLIVKGRITHLNEIAKEFDAHYNEELGIVEGIVYSTAPLNKQQLAAVEKAVSKKEGKQVVLKQKTDKSLIGGIKVVIGDHVLDGSLKNKMDSLQGELLKGSR